MSKNVKDKTETFSPMRSPEFDFKKHYERLREALQNIASDTCCEPCQEAKLAAKSELDWVGECHDNPMFAAEYIVKLEAENQRLRDALVRINDASNQYAMTPTYSEGTLRAAHKSTRNLAREALQEGE